MINGTFFSKKGKIYILWTWSSQTEHNYIQELLERGNFDFEVDLDYIISKRW